MLYLKGKNLLTYFLLFIIFIKFVFIISALGHLILSHTPNKELDAKFVYWKERTEFVFIACMAILLIYHFKPGHLKPIEKETTILFFLFGWILLVTAKWSLFFTEAKWYKDIVFYLK